MENPFVSPWKIIPDTISRWGKKAARTKSFLRLKKKYISSRVVEKEWVSSSWLPVLFYTWRLLFGMDKFRDATLVVLFFLSLFHSTRQQMVEEEEDSALGLIGRDSSEVPRLRLHFQKSLIITWFKKAVETPAQNDSCYPQKSLKWGLEKMLEKYDMRRSSTGVCD